MSGACCKSANAGKAVSVRALQKQAARYSLSTFVVTSRNFKLMPSANLNRHQMNQWQQPAVC